MDPQVQTNPAASSPAPITTEAPKTPEFVPGIPTGEARMEWRKTGKKPAPKESPKTEAPAASTEEVSDAPPEKEESESAAAPEAAPVQEPKPKPRSNAETRLSEILADLKKAGLSPAELKTFKREAQKAETQADPLPAAPAKLEAPKKPVMADFESFDKYEEARDKYYEDLADYKAKSAVEEDRARRAQEQQQKEWQSKIDDARKRYPDFDDKAGPALKSIFDDKAVHPAIKELVNASPVLSDLLYVIGGNEDDMADFIQAAKTNPIEAIRKTVLLESLVKDELAKGSKKEESPNGVDRDASGKFVSGKVPDNKVSSAPPPPKEVSGKGAPPPDAEEAARASGNFRELMRIRNQRDIARMKGLRN